MTRSSGISAPFAILLGIFLLVEGAWGMTSPVVFGVLTTNWLHAAIHIVLGIMGVWTGLKGGARGFLTFVGWLVLVVGILYYMPVAGAMVVSLLNVNGAVAILNIVVGIVAILVARSARPDVVVVERV